MRIQWHGVPPSFPEQLTHRYGTCTARHSTSGSGEGQLWWSGNSNLLLRVAVYNLQNTVHFAYLHPQFHCKIVNNERIERRYMLDFLIFVKRTIKNKTAHYCLSFTSLMLGNIPRDDSCLSGFLKQDFAGLKELIWHCPAGLLTLVLYQQESLSLKHGKITNSAVQLLPCYMHLII